MYCTAFHCLVLDVMHKTVKFSLDSRFTICKCTRSKRSKGNTENLDIDRNNSNQITALHCSTSNWNWSKQTSADLSFLFNVAQLFKASQLTNWVNSQNKTNKKNWKKVEFWIFSWNCLNLWAVRHIDFLKLKRCQIADVYCHEYIYRISSYSFRPWILSSLGCFLQKKTVFIK